MRSAAATLIICLALAACGGDGGGSAAPKPTPGEAQGAWTGVLEDGRAFETLILEDGTFYALYGRASAGTLYASGAVVGFGEYEGNSAFRDLNARDFVSTGSWIPAILDGYYERGKVIYGSVIEAGRNVKFTGSPTPTANYDYDAPAVLGALAGTWRMNATSGDAVDLSVNGNTLTASSGGCSFSGSVAPRASGKNVFDVQFTFGGSPCRFPGEQMRGNAVLTRTDRQQQQLIVIALNGSGSQAIAAFGVR